MFEECQRESLFHHFSVFLNNQISCNEWHSSFCYPQLRNIFYITAQYKHTYHENSFIKQHKQCSLNYLYHRVSQLLHQWLFELDNSLLWGAALSTVRCLAVSLAFTHQMPVTLPLPLPKLWQPKASLDIANILEGSRVPQLRTNHYCHCLSFVMLIVIHKIMFHTH